MIMKPGASESASAMPAPVQLWAAGKRYRPVREIVSAHRTGRVATERETHAWSDDAAEETALPRTDLIHEIIQFHALAGQVALDELLGEHFTRHTAALEPPDSAMQRTAQPQVVRYLELALGRQIRR